MNFVSAQELARILDIDPSTLAKLSRNGWLPMPLRLGHRIVRYDMDRVMSRIESLQELENNSSSGKVLTVPTDDATEE